MNLKSSGGMRGGGEGEREEKLSMAEAPKTTSRPIGHMNYTYCRPRRSVRKTFFTYFVSLSQ